MANTQRGETLFQAGGRDYTLAFTTNAIALAEERLKAGVGGIFQRWAKDDWAAAEVRVLLWAALRRHHARLTPDQAGDLIDAVGAGEALKAVVQAWVASQPPVEDPSGNGKAASGSGPAS